MPSLSKEASNALKKVYRLANDADMVQHSKNLDLEGSARTYCLECAVKLRLEMNLASVACLFDRSKLIFYYTADGRVDFRELVKMLIKAYKVRIEMRQIGVRNRAKMCGGFGRCGQSLCCRCTSGSTGGRRRRPRGARTETTTGIETTPFNFRSRVPSWHQ